MEPLPIGVVGVGHLGSLHTKMLAQISAVHLVGVTDIDNARAEKKAQEFSTKAFRSVDELLPHVKAIVIATPTTIHFDVARLAIEKNVHVFIEKPITSTVEQARILVEEAKKHRTIIQVGHIERFNPAILALEKYQLNPMFI